ncbi:putative sensor with HAMP domain [Solidesulfovibrio fructosivorans JJ]]|uniref:Putative sensor with HAMP domain n=1 Tax=Solidesulfovibrio fructosivorans JJ] TaxID=596151 RepID=E1JSI5_SOLFR|nr:HAMP domain-containing protein [Solidesulfovibrio fructosivorans]EFL52670.1 putative sensor with HAMP domain [Solidesulfovibrio fructosivorans JJ]]
MLRRFSLAGRQTPTDRHVPPRTPWSILQTLLLVLVPAVIVLLAATGLLLMRSANSSVETAIARGSLSLTLAQARELETLLTGCREDAVALAHKPVTRERLHDFMEGSAAARGMVYAETTFVPAGAGEPLVLLKSDGRVAEVAPDVARRAKNSPLTLSRKAASLQTGQASLSALTEVYYPPMGLGFEPRQRNLALFRLTTPVAGPDARPAGFLILSVDARAVRNILSLYNSPQSPILGFRRTRENRQSIFVDGHGWMLFQSEDLAEPTREISVAGVKPGLSGDMGSPGFDGAFRPAPDHQAYWRMIEAISQGHAGMERAEPGFGPPKIAPSDDFVGYAPVRFAGTPGDKPEVVGGIIYIDRSLLPRAAQFNQGNILFLATVVGALVMAALIVVLSGRIARPMTRLADALREMRHEGHLRELEPPGGGAETTRLGRVCNRLIAALRAREVTVDDGREAATREAHPSEMPLPNAPEARQTPNAPPVAPAPAPDPFGDASLSERQRAALLALLDRGVFSRQDYQEAGGDIPQRTAQHDLQDLVGRGVLDKDGRGPATRYRLRRASNGA